ncbi:hypothetical protein [Curtobacterium flaccumfaciens]|uniref:hypothetical protein n=1 Tax=Curtobacterium flaccumfaciens TaxID=2035 RepID=UPI001E5153CB|nr:hypothetical protein [Curtobacterium allii]MCE0459698.1 hypothetical protein [Curtobacterium allii]
MHYLFHDRRALLTTSAAAGAVVEYSAVLQRAQRSDDVDVPAIDTDGFVVRERLHIEPTSRLRAVPAADDLLEDDDADFVADLAHRRAALRAR